MASSAAAKRPFNYKKTVIVGFGFLGISIIWPIFNQYIPIFLQAGNPAFEGGTDVRGFGLGPALALFIMTWDNLINVFVQPWVGAKSDRTWNRFGQRKPWILLGVPIALVGFTLIPFAQTAVAIAAFILITNFGMALFRSPTVAWLGDLYQPEDRSKANGIINLMGGIGGLLAFFGGGLLFEQFSAIDPELGRMAPFIGGGILLVAAALVALLGVREPEKISTEAEPDDPGVMANLRTVWRNPNKSGLIVLLGILLWFMAFNALEAGLSSFAVFTLDISPGIASIYAGSITISFILFAVPAGLIGTKYGRRQAIRIGLTGLTLLMLAGYFLIQGAVMFIVVLVLAGIFWSCVNVNSLPLVYDHGDERRIGAYTGLYYFSSQLAAVLGPTLGGLVVDSLDNNYRWLFLFSALFMGLAWVAMQRVKPN
ncbi:MFS transporter [Candidatus Leptofilum sp.]|uniref:MFS transporter n=1 Tax=Candidatus Leptofilum sp. TaxID=3241576 RepID=UPI003B5915F6